ncbi:diguanylate cyclase domain-containing protein [Neobacillus bataviensis]|uniref:diguanylate cyclase domain-containing protein n=1 Tax=Neobacillus bataviensis TaxID=220685 RepID=UPI001CC0EB4F|nr:diguanylate cyclase [Neobacillus bataviensis]
MTVIKKWYILILIYLIPPIFDQTGYSEELIWLIYIFPAVWLPFYFGMKGGLIAAILGTFIYAANEIIEIVFKKDVYHLNDIWFITIITVVNFTIAITIGRLVEQLKSEQHSLKKVIEKVEYMAFHDYLTGLPNRWHFEMKLKEALEHAKQMNKIVAVLFLDLDRFKLINDSLGHAVGDKILKEVSKRIQVRIKGNNCLARQGGDEFILFFSDITSRKDVERYASEIHNAIQAPFKIETQEYFISSSIGISIYPSDGLGWEELIQQADIAMYTAKEKGGNGFQWYNHAKQQEIHDVLKIETHLRKALQRKEFTLHYQPLVNINNEQIVDLKL